MKKDLTNIRLVKERDLVEVGKIFMVAFNRAANIGWTEKTVNEYMCFWFKKEPDLFFISEIDDKVIGGAMGSIRPRPKGNELIDVNLFVDDAYQNQGIGKRLFKELIKKAIKEYKVTNVVSMADKTAKFPMSWYKKIGFKQCRWVQIEAKPGTLLEKL